MSAEAPGARTANAPITAATSPSLRDLRPVIPRTFPPRQLAWTPRVAPWSVIGGVARVIFARCSTLTRRHRREGARVRAVVFAGAGGNEVIRLEELPDPVPGSEELLPRVTHAGLNPADLSQREGSYPAPPGSPSDIPGLEVSGTVEACGAQVLGWKPGDRAFGLVGGGGLADRVVVHQRCVTAVPDALDEPGAAAVPEAFITAHDAIRIQSELSMGETLLVHGAAGGVGSAAVQIGVTTGASVFGSVRSADAAALVRELGGEPVDDAGFADEVLAATGGRG